MTEAQRMALLQIEEEEADRKDLLARYQETEEALLMAWLDEVDLARWEQLRAEPVEPTYPYGKGWTAPMFGRVQ